MAGNLPIQLTRFIGREREIETVAQLLGQTRTLTLTGAGGVGKSRLALQVAERTIDDYPDGAWLVDLALQTRLLSEPPDPLNVREREVAVLVARGLSNNEIAETLVLSVRTTEAHVTHALTKLGLRSRSQLALWMAERTR